MSDRTAYPGDAPDVERLETHASVVFLAGERAYKMKRAVRFSYLDYSTLAQRRAFCEAEVRLNRRTAPDLYDGVLPVTREAGGRLALDGTGEPVEWLVVMRRFDQDGLFDRLATGGRLTEEHMAQAADRVATFHMEAEVHRAATDSVPLRQIIDENAAELEAGAGDVFSPEDLADLEADSVGRAEALGPLLERRRQGGFIRHCHGDLHLRNLVLHRGVPVLFDCIEFSAAFAVIDVFYDLAFLLMDLLHRGLDAHANRTCNRYLQRTGDYEGLAPLPLFLACRAAIRAHVSVAAAAAQSDPARAAPVRAEARQYLALARNALSPPPPCLMAVGGLSGTGKSALARAVAPRLGPAPGAVILRSDVIRKRLLGAKETERLSPDAYTRDVSRRVYRILGEETALVVAAGHSVIADAVCATPAERSTLADTARKAGAAFEGIWLEAPIEVREERVDFRTADASDANREVVRSQDEIDTGRIEWRSVDAGRAPEQVRDDVVAGISKNLLRLQS